MKIIAAVIGGFIVAFASDAYFHAVLASGEDYIAMVQKGLSFPGWGWLVCMVVVWGAAVFVAMRSTSAAKAWRKLLLCAGILLLLNPIAYLIVWAKAGAAFQDGINTTANSQGGFNINNLNNLMQMMSDAHFYAALQTALVISAVISVLIGIVCLIIGLLVGKDPQVVYISPNPPPS